MCLLNNLLNHRLNILLLLLQERLHISNIKRPLCEFPVLLLLQTVADPLLDDLQSVSRILAVQFREVTDRSDTSEDRLIPNKGRLWSERGHHANALSASIRF